MNKSQQFKILQRRLKFRNPNHWIDIPTDFTCSAQEASDADAYLQQLENQKIFYTHPGHENYPKSFLQMKEPPLFLEYQGFPFWKTHALISIVGSRQITSLTESWMKNHLPVFLSETRVASVSGGALGVDQLAHTLSLKSGTPTVFVLPSGLSNLYPDNLKLYQKLDSQNLCCFVSEFEQTQRIHKSHFYFRNRLISAFSEMTLVTQASLKSGSLLTVHHCLENGRPVLVVPSHPELIGYDGNTKLIREGAYATANAADLLDFWKAELWAK